MQYSRWCNGKKRGSNGGVGVGNNDGGNSGGKGKGREAKVHGAVVAMATVVGGEDHVVAGHGWKTCTMHSCVSGRSMQGDNAAAHTQIRQVAEQVTRALCPTGEVAARQ